MKILIVEDSKTDREILKYLLESRFQREAKFREASNLEVATSYLLRGDINCVILDLQLPDSAGKETFTKLATRFPEVPIIVMTNNKDRNLAIEMIQQGAVDFILKKFTDEEDIFRRVLFAVERHQNSVRMPPEEASSIRKLEAAQAKMLSAHQSGEHQAVQGSVVDVSNSTADLSRRMFTEIQKNRKDIATQAANNEQVSTLLGTLRSELLEGYPDKPSLKSQVEIVTQRVASLEAYFDLKRNTQFELTPNEVASRRVDYKAVVLGVLGVAVGILVAMLLK